MISFFLEYPGLVAHTASFLSGCDTLRLTCVSRLFHDYLSEPSLSEIVFRSHLLADFPEGEQLGKLSSRQSCKNMYKAFLHRWKGPALTVERRENVLVPDWRPPITDEEKSLAQKDADALEFIIRLGDHPKSCYLLGWDEDTDSGEVELFLPAVPNGGAGPTLPNLEPRICQFMDSMEDDDEAEYQDITAWDIKRSLAQTYLFTLHVFDVETNNVVTILENARAESSSYLGTKRLRLHGLHCLYGSPHTLASPYYQPERTGIYPHLFQSNPPCLDLSISLSLERISDLNQTLTSAVCPEENSAIIYLEWDEDTLPTEATTQDSLSAFSLFRALIRQNSSVNASRAGDSAGVIAPPSCPSVVPSQPKWVTTHKILDRIIGFIPFEEKTTMIRLVCKSFKTVAIRQLKETILDPTLVVGWRHLRYGESCDSSTSCCFRRGWSNELSSRESVVENAVWMLSCRCDFGCCHKKDECRWKHTKPSFHDGDGNLIDFDEIEAARHALTAEKNCAFRGNIGVDYETTTWNQSSLQINDLFRVGGVGSSAEGIPVQETEIPVSFGLSTPMTFTRLFRAIGLVLSDGASLTKGHFPRFSCTNVYADFVSTDEMLHEREMKVFRFLTAMDEAVEFLVHSHEKWAEEEDDD